MIKYVRMVRSLRIEQVSPQKLVAAFRAARVAQAAKVVIAQRTEDIIGENDPIGLVVL